MRMRDALGTTDREEIYGNQFLEIIFSPHDFHYQRIRGSIGYSHPDDPRVMHMSTFNRKHKAKEYYYEKVGETSSMVYPR
jgi:hypothetical protein